MNSLIRASDVIGRPVVSIDSGEDVAEVRDVVYDANEHRLIGFTLNKRGFLAGRLKDVLGAGALAALGGDALMIKNDTAITRDDVDSKEIDHGAAPMSVIGNRVLTAEGNCLGKVSGVILTSGVEPQAVGYEIEPEQKGPSVFAPISAQIALSDDNLILPESATELLRGDLESFAAAVHR